ncbi:hypothetical protein [Aeoliella sp.]|uniref:hypothetical protein n=1 Tax=Aeoliella sp. TaxID=2795800 RepID=UPI003CCBAC26
MAIRNPVSRTHFKFTADRIQHYSDDLVQCSACGHDYYPKVHSQPYLVQFAAILVGLSVFLAFKLHAPPWLYVVGPVAILVATLLYARRDRRIHNRSERLRYGDIVPECPECGSDKLARTF